MVCVCVSTTINVRMSFIVGLSEGVILNTSVSLKFECEFELEYKWFCESQCKNNFLY